MKPVPLSDKTRTVGKPADWIDELDGECLSLDVYDYIDDITGISFMRTCWELESGQRIWLDIAGKHFPVIKWWEE